MEDLLNVKNNINTTSNNLKLFDNLLNINNNTFDNNSEADYILSNIYTMTNKDNNMMDNMEANIDSLLNLKNFETNSPLYKFPYEENNFQNDLLLKYLNDCDYDKMLQYNNPIKESNLFDIKFNENTLNFDDMCNDTYTNTTNFNSNNNFNNDLNLNKEKENDNLNKENSYYITEGTGTILKIIEASQLWLKHTSSEKVPIKLKKQFTKNDNFVILIKKQSN